MVFQVGLGGVVEIVRLFEMVWDGKSGKWESGSPTPGCHLRSHIRVAEFFFNLQLFVNSGKHYQTEAAGDWLPSYQNFWWWCCTPSLGHTDLGSNCHQAGKRNILKRNKLGPCLLAHILPRCPAQTELEFNLLVKRDRNHVFFTQPTCSM